MGITDWNKWMEEHHIYIPTKEEAEAAIRMGYKKVKQTSRNARAMQQLLEEANIMLQDYKKKAAASQ